MRRQRASLEEVIRLWVRTGGAHLCALLRRRLERLSETGGNHRNWLVTSWSLASD